tara:strand:- start:368 stop:1006 length:639 start_codon:yes stop_codon:yes gene_type:complete
MPTKTIIINNTLLFDFNKLYLKDLDNEYFINAKYPELQIKVEKEENIKLNSIVKESKILLNENYHLAVNLSNYLVQLIMYLIENNKVIPYYELDDFEIINNNILFTNTDKIIDFKDLSNYNFEINKTSKIIFLSNNEISQLKNIEKTRNSIINLTIKSLSYVLLYILNKNIILKNGINILQAYKSLDIISGTKLYYFLEKTKEGTNKKLIYI